MEYIQENERTLKKDEGGINLRDVVELIIANWYWFVLSVLLCVGSAYFYVLTIQPVYQRQAVMLVKDKEKSASDMSAMLEVSGGITGTSVDNEIYILRSHQLLREVVNRLHLDVDYAKDGILRDTPLYAESPVDVHFIDPYNQPVSFNITPLNMTKFRISDWKVMGEKGEIQEQELAYNDTIRTEAGRIVVQLRPENLSAYLSQAISVSRISPEIATNIYQSKIATSLAGERTTLVQITCSDTNISRADAILAALVKVYSETIIEDKNRIAANTAKFIDERISIISRELSDVEEDLTDFKQRNQIVDMSANATQYLAESSKVKEESAQLETELSIARSIKSYLADVTRKDQLIPNVTGVGDVSMQSQITAYNELMLQRNRLKESSGEKNPVVQAADKNLEGMRATISGSMDNYMKTLRLRLDKAKIVENRLASSIQAVPKQEKMALSIMRQQSIKETLYTFLLNKREENALQLAITEANIRVVEEPFGSYLPVSPARSSILAAAFIVGLLIPLGVQVIILLLNTSVRGRKDIEEYTTIPIVGEIPARKDSEGDDAIVVSDSRNDRISEAFRMLRVDLNFIAKEARVLMFTSTLSGEGKSFVSRNLAVALAISGKKVILLDTDLRKHTQSKLAGVNRKEGLSTYLSGLNSNMDTLITVGAFHPQVDTIFAGIIPPNPAELLMNERFDLLIEELKKRYDYIILDNVPALVVADASIVSRVTDLTIYVIRDGVLDRRYLPELERLHQDGKFKNMCIVLNDSQVEKKKYGYGYGQGYGYGYGYGRVAGYYSEENNDKK